MICKGILTKEDIKSEVIMVNSDGLQIYCCTKNISAPGKFVIHGCDGKYNYMGEILNQNSKDIFVISENEIAIVEIEKLPSLLIPRCKITHNNRKLTVKFSVKSGKATMQLLDDGDKVASMSFIKNNYEVIIKSDENPTLSAAILVGISEVNRLADRALSKV